MAVYPDRIVLKNSTDSDSAIRTAIGTGGTDPISQGEIVLGVTGTDLTIYSVDGAGNVITVSGTGSSGLAAVVDDTAPQLGGNLDVNGNYIVSTTAGDIEIAPDTTGNFIIRGNDTDGSITLNCTANTHGVTIQSPPHSAAATYTLVLPDNVGTSGQALTTDGSGNLSWANAGGSVASIDDIGDVDTTTTPPTDGQALVWDNANSQWEPGTVSGAASAAGVHVTQAVAASSGVLTFDQIGSAGLVRKVASDITAWVVLYSSAAARTADAGRSFSTDPSLSSGVLFEAYITGGGEVLATPGTGYFNDDATPGDAIYAAVRDNAGTAVNATVTFYGYAHGGFVPSDYIDKATLQTETAASTDFADFQSRIAAL